jgi:hypothetical protein
MRIPREEGALSMSGDLLLCLFDPKLDVYFLLSPARSDLPIAPFFEGETDGFETT